MTPRPFDRSTEFECRCFSRAGRKTSRASVPASQPGQHTTDRPHPYRYEGRRLDVANHRYTGHATGRPVYSCMCRWFVDLTQRPALRSRLRHIYPSASRTVVIPTVRCSGGSVDRCLATPTPRCDDHSLLRKADGPPGRAVVVTSGRTLDVTTTRGVDLYKRRRIETSTL